MSTKRIKNKNTIVFDGEKTKPQKTSLSVEKMMANDAIILPLIDAAVKKFMEENPDFLPEYR